jgi:hypothetical protein
MNHRHGQVAALDYYLRARTHTGEQPGKVAGGFGFRYVNNPVGHDTIIPSLSTRFIPNWTACQVQARDTRRIKKNRGSIRLNT